MDATSSNRISAELITDLELCSRRGLYSREYESNRLHPTEITRRAIYTALCSEDLSDVGQAAGDEVMRMCSVYHIDLKDDGHLYDVALHHAAIADLVATWARDMFKATWTTVDETFAGEVTWIPNSLFMNNGIRLMRIILVDHVTEERIAAEQRSWYTAGDMAAFGVEMKLVFIVLGQSVGGKRHSPWAKGYLHPRNRKLRFTPKAHKVEGFKESWKKIWREDYAQITREEWLNAMSSDGVFNDLVKIVTLDAYNKDRAQEVFRIINRKSTYLSKLTGTPDPSFSACDWPRPCIYRRVCFAPVKVTPEDVGFWQRER